MPTSNLLSMGAVQLGTTMLPAVDVNYSPNIGGPSFRHDNREFASIQTVSSAAPVFTFSTPIKAAIDAIGLRVTKFTAFDFYLAKYTDAVHQATSKKYSESVGATAYAVITGFSIAHGGIAMANVMVALLSSDGDTNPVIPGDEAIPAISEPLLHTLAGVVVNGASIAGVQSVDGQLSQRWAPHFADGKLYPELGSYDGGAPVLSVAHADPVTVLALGDEGVPISSTTTVTLNAFDATNQVPTTTGRLLITIASGRVVPNNLSAQVGGIAQVGFDIIGLSAAAQTHPWVFSEPA